MTPWPPDELLAANRNAMTVYGVLRWLSGERRQLATTRKSIRGVCRLSEDTISEAMTALDSAGWVSVGYGREGVRTWYRLTFPVADFFPVPAKGRHRKGKVSRKKAAQRASPCTGKKAAPSLRKGAACADAPSAPHGASVPAPGQGEDRDPIDGPAPGEPIIKIADLAAGLGGARHGK